MQHRIPRSPLLAVVVLLAALITANAIATLTRPRAARTAQAQTQRITGYDEVTAAPLLVESISVGGRAVQLGEEFPAPEGWRATVQVTARNVSEKAVSAARFILYQTGGTEPGNSINLSYGAGCDGPEAPFVQPDETFTLRAGAATGSDADGRNYRLVLDRVEWNGDDSVIWKGGFLRIKQPDGSYRNARETPPAARYVLPERYRAIGRSRYALSAATVTPSVTPTATPARHGVRRKT